MIDQENDMEAAIQFEKTQEYQVDAIQKQQYSATVKRCQDDTKIIEKALIEMKKCYQALIETNMYGILEINIHGDIVFANPTMLQIIGFQIDELKVKTVWELLVSQEERDNLSDRLAKLAKGEHPPFPWIGKFFRKDGSDIKLQIDWNYRRDKKGNVLGFISVISDIIVSKQTAAQPLPVSDKFRRMAEHAREIMIILDMDGNITYVNPIAAETVGFFEEEILEMNIADILPPDQFDIIKNKLFHSTPELSSDNLHEVSLINRELKIFPTELSFSLISQDDQPSEILIVGRNLTQRRQLEFERRRDEKFDTISTFANGIVQDFHDFITSIVGNTDTCLNLVESDSNIHERLIAIKLACSGFKDLTRQFVIFSRGGMPMKQPDSIEDLIRRTAKEVLEGSEIQCQFDIPKDLWQMAYDQRQISQALEILIQNSKENSSKENPIDKGQIFVRLENMEVTQAMKDLPITIKEGRYVKISIQNQGQRIPREHMDKIFDPYFTSKKIRTKKGTGLGLTIAYGIIRQHQGFIYADSTEGGKTTFHVFFPALKKEMRS